MKFEVGDIVQCLWGSGTLKYEAKIVKVDDSKPKTPYLVHYIGWNDRWDGWVPEKRIIGVSPSSSSVTSTGTTGRRNSSANKNLVQSTNQQRKSTKSSSPSKSNVTNKERLSSTSRNANDDDNSHLATSSATTNTTHIGSTESATVWLTTPTNESSTTTTINAASSDHQQSKSTGKQQHQSLSPPPPVVSKSKTSLNSSTANRKSPNKSMDVTKESHFAEEISPDMFRRQQKQLSGAVDEPDFSLFQEPEDAAAAAAAAMLSSPKGKRTSRGSQLEPASKQRRVPVVQANVPTVDKQQQAPRSTRRGTKKVSVDDQQQRTPSLFLDRLANELETEDTEFIEIQESVDDHHRKASASTSVSTATDVTPVVVVAAAKRSPAKSKPTTVANTRGQNQIKRQSETILLATGNIAAAHSDYKSNIPRQQQQFVVDNHQRQHHIGYEHHPETTRYASLQGITVTGIMPTSLDGTAPPPNRVIMKLKPATGGTRLFQKVRSPPSAETTGIDYVQQPQPYYSPQLHVGGRGRFGVVGAGPPPSLPMPDKSSDFTYLPPQIVSDHCYGKMPPMMVTATTGGGQQASSSDHHHVVVPTNYGTKGGRLVPTTTAGHHITYTTTIAQQQQPQPSSIVYQQHRGRLVPVTPQHHNYESSRRLRTIGGGHDHNSESPPSSHYISRVVVAGGGGNFLSEGLGDGYADSGQVTVGAGGGGFESTPGGSMMPGGSSLIHGNVDKMPANILDDDELTDSSAIDIQ